MSSICSSSPDGRQKSKFDNNNVVKTQCINIKKMGDNRGSYKAIKSDITNCKTKDEVVQNNTSSTTAVKKRRKSTACHLNNLWSIWYGIFCTALQTYAAIKCLKRISGKYKVKIGCYFL